MAQDCMTIFEKDKLSSVANVEQVYIFPFCLIVYEVGISAVRPGRLLREKTQSRLWRKWSLFLITEMLGKCHHRFDGFY